MTFPRVKALGWGLFEPFTSSQATQLDIDHSKATDSTYVKDYGAALFLPVSIAVASWSRTSAIAYVAPLNTWVGCSTGGSCRTVGAGFVIAASTFPAGLSGMTNAAIAFDGASVLICGAGSTSSADKIRRTTVAANCDVWTAQNAAVSSSATCTVLGWFQVAGLFVAGYSNGHIETSPDGITWTARTPANAFSQVGFATNGAIAVMIQSDATTRFQYATSTDGITWTNRAFPTIPGTAMAGVSYSPIDGSFLAITTGGETAYRSVDGINWTAIAPTFAASIGSIGAIGSLHSLSNLWLATFNASNGGLMCSIDLGLTWRPVHIVGVSTVCLGVSTGQVAFVDTASAHFSNMLSI